jgi:YD repeat-containing protein
VQFVRDAAGRIASLTAPDGRRFAYAYDAGGNLIAARDLSAGESIRYGYAAADAHLLTLATGTPGGGSAGAVVRYLPAATVSTLAGDLGPASRYLLDHDGTAGTLRARGTSRYAFSVRPTELAATRDGQVFIGVTVRAAGGSGLQPAMPSIPGLTPVATDAAPHVVRPLRHRSRRPAFAGDQRRHERRRVHAESLGRRRRQRRRQGRRRRQPTPFRALGSSAGDANYVPAADFDRNGSVDAADVRLQAAESGYAANRAPVASDASRMTHRELELTVPLAGLVSDPEDDAVYFRVTAPSTARPYSCPDGRSVSFLPAAGYDGPASFTFVADDGYGVSGAGEVHVNVSSAPLVGLDIQNRKPRFARHEGTRLVVIGDFADQQDVVLPASYLTFTSSNPAVASVSGSGYVAGLANGTAAVSVSRGPVQAATAVAVGDPGTIREIYLSVAGLNTYPQTFTLTEGGSRQMVIRVGQTSSDVSGAAAGTRYFVGDARLISVSPDGLVTALGTGETTLTVVNGSAETVGARPRAGADARPARRRPRRRRRRGPRRHRRDRAEHVRPPRHRQRAAAAREPGAARRAGLPQLRRRLQARSG